METLAVKKKAEEKTKVQSINGSVAVLEAFVAEGVDTIFGYPGGAIMPIYDALYDYSDKLKHILVRHEQGAIHAAQGYARTSGRTGVVFATSGPGATNLVTGLADAMIDSTPVVCITGQVFAHLLGTDAFQETDVINITTPVTKWNYQVTDAKEIPSVLAKAFYIAGSGRPGPVLIDITKNAQLQVFDYEGYTKCDHIRSYRPKPIVRKEYVEEAAKLINAAEKPFVIFGQGVILGKAEKEFQKFIEKSGIPAAWTIMGMSAIDTNHPLAVGMLGMHGNYGPNLLTNECDVLIAVGMRFDDRVTGRLDKYAKQAKVVHLDIDPAEIDKNVKATVPVWGDCKETLPMLTALIEQKVYPQWLKKFKDCAQKEEDKVAFHVAVQVRIVEAVGFTTVVLIDRDSARFAEEELPDRPIGHRHYRRSHRSQDVGGLVLTAFAAALVERVLDIPFCQSRDREPNTFQNSAADRCGADSRHIGYKVCAPPAHFKISVDQQHYYRKPDQRRNRRG